MAFLQVWFLSKTNFMYLLPVGRLQNEILSCEVIIEVKALFAVHIWLCDFPFLIREARKATAN